VRVRPGIFSRCNQLHSQSSTKVQRLIAAGLSANTRRAYAQDLKDFVAWGGSVPCSPEMLASYIADRAADLAPATIRRRVQGVCRAHVLAGMPNPGTNELIRAVMQGVRRTFGRPCRAVTPLLVEDLPRVLPTGPDTRDVRDRALLLLGFGAALRRGELVALRRTDVRFVPEGALICVRSSKTDPSADGRHLAIPLSRGDMCAVQALREWMGRLPEQCWPLFPRVGRFGRGGLGRVLRNGPQLYVMRCSDDRRTDGVH
jgi:integrase